MHARRFRHRPAARQRGAVAIILGITLAVLIGFAGLALDLGRFFIIKTELQNAMDACALSASTQLRPGQNDPNALTRAVAYGRVFTTGGAGASPAIMNRVNFQEDVVDVQPANITFSEDLGGPYVAQGSADPNTAAFVQCSLPLTDIPVFFMRVLNPLLTTQTVSALAVATLAPSASTCAIPIAVCRTPTGIAANNFGLTVGQWLVAPEGNGSTYGTGNFGWVDFTPPGGGASELADLLTGSGQCSLTVGAEVGQSGNITSLDQAWNTRFGVYHGSLNTGNAPPDRTGFAFTSTNWPSQSNAYAGAGSNYTQQVAAYTPFQGPLSGGSNSITSAEHQAFNQLRRVAVAPIVDCSTWAVGSTGGANPPLEGFACVLMLNPVLGNTNDSSNVLRTHKLEFLGLSTSPGSPCATTGEPGTFGPLVPQLVQ